MLSAFGVNAASGQTPTLSLPTQSAVAARHWELKADWKLSGVRSEEKGILSESTRAQFEGKFKLTGKFDEELKLKVSPAIRVVSGRDQDVFSDRLPKDKLYANEFKVAWTPLKYAELEAGAINQSHVQNSLAVYDRPFPAVRAAYGTRTRQSAGWLLSAQGAIPSSYTLEAQATDNEPLPQLQTYSAEAAAKWGSDFEVEAGTSYFHYTRLPRVVALASKRYGNDVQVFNSANANFRTRFEGLAPWVTANLSAGRWDLGWKGLGIHNFGAPSGQNTGYVSTVTVARSLNSVHKLSVSGSYYKIESDTSPSYYTDPIFANNRVGYGTTATVEHRRWKLSFRVRYFHDEPYFRSDLMGNRDVFLVELGNSSEETLASF